MKIKLTFILIMFSVLVFADNTPMPQDTPNGFPAPAVPPPPPPLPIDNNIMWLMLLGIVFVFYIMYLRKNRLAIN